MFQSIKKLFKQSAIYGIGHIITRSMGFLLLPLHTNVFDKADFGAATVIFSYLAILNILYTYGLDAAFLRYYILEENAKNKKIIFSTAFLSVLLISIFLSGTIFLNAETIGHLTFSNDSKLLNINLTLLIQICSGILIFDALEVLPFLILRAEERPRRFVTYKFINVMINLLLNVLFIIVLKMGVTGIFWANLAASVSTFLLLIPVAARQFSLGFSTKYLRDLFSFGLPYIPSTLSVVLMDTVDRIIIERMMNAEAAGVYGAGARLGMFMSLFVAAFRFAWHPYFLATSKQPDAKQIFSRLLTYIIAACGVVFLLISFFIDELVRLKIFGFTIFGQGYWESTVVVPMIMLAYVVYAAYLFFLIGIYLEKKSGYLPFVTVLGMVVNLAVNIWLIPLIGILGAAWARFVSYLVMTTALYFIGMKLYPIKFEYLRLGKLILVLALAFALAQIKIPMLFGLYKLVLLLLVPVALYLMHFFYPSELNKARNLLRRIKG